MLRSEVQNMTGLTRKAIEYYEEKGLITPKRFENEYRDYSEEDVIKLKKIAIYRRFDLSIEDIRKLINSKVNASGAVIREKEIELKHNYQKLNLLNRLIKGESVIQIHAELEQLLKQETIYQRLIKTFPGYFGQVMFSAYQPFLQEVIEESKEEVFQEYINFLDNLPKFTLTSDEQDFIEKITAQISQSQSDKVSLSRIEAVNDFDHWLEKNQEAIISYQEMINTPEFKASPMYTIKEKMRDYMVENHYYEKAIPLIRTFSRSYNEYYDKLLLANDALAEKGIVP